MILAYGRVAKLVNAPVLETGGEILVGSSPTLATVFSIITMKDKRMKQTQTQEVTPDNFINFLKSKGVISEDTKVSFIIDTKYAGNHDNYGTPFVSNVRLVREVEVVDSLL